MSKQTVILSNLHKYLYIFVSITTTIWYIFINLSQKTTKPNSLKS